MEFAASLVSAALETGSEVMMMITTTLLAVILAFLLLPATYRFLYTVLDEHGNLITTRGKIVEKRHFLDYWSVGVEVVGVVEFVPLSREFFEAVTEGDEIDLSVRLGKFSQRPLHVCPIRPHVDTYA